jgi:hypothetical protein
MHQTQGLEVEVQRLISRHKAELAASHERAADGAKAAADAARCEAEAAAKALKERMRRVRPSRVVVFMLVWHCMLCA